MKITVCGSVKFVADMRKAKSVLEKLGHAVLLPLSAELDQDKSYWDGLKSEDIKKYAESKGERMKGHFDKIKSSDAILVLNYDKDGRKNYIGPNTLMEMAVAFEHGKRIFVLNEPPHNESHYEEIVSMQPTCLNSDLGNLA